MQSEELFRAKKTFIVAVKGGSITVNRGDIVQDKHPVMAGREGLFEPLVVRFKRAAGRPSSKAKASDDEK